MKFFRDTGYRSPRRRSLYGVLLVALVGLLSGCVEVMSSPAPRPEVLTSGLGATRREWEHQHRLDGPFEGNFIPGRLRGLVYDGAYRVTYWVDGPQEVAPTSARISRIEFDTPERDPETLQALAHKLLPDDAILNNFYGPSGESSDFMEVFLCPSLGTAYKQLEYTDGVSGNGYELWVNVSYSSSTPNITIQIGPWNGLPPEYIPSLPIPTLPVSVPSVDP